MQRKIATVVLLAAIGLSAQTTVYVRDAESPAPVQITGAADNGNYIRLTVPSGHGFAEGDKVAVLGVRGCWRANGTRTVAAAGATTVDLLGRDGSTTLDCGGTFIAASAYTGSPQYSVAKLTSHTLVASPNVSGFDGPAGTFTTSLASRVSVSNPAWVAIKSVADSTATNYSSMTWDTAVWATALAWHASGRDTESTYLTAAKHLINNAHLAFHGPGCDEDQSICGRYTSIDQIEPDLEAAATAFSLIYDQLSAGERTAFAQKMLNDLGLNNDTETSCTNVLTTGTGTMTVPSSGRTVTVSPASAIASVQVGALVTWTITTTLADETGGAYYVASKDDEAGTITVSRDISASFAGTAARWFYFNDPDTWGSSYCGYAWFCKHFTYQPGLVPSGSEPADHPYPPTGGDVASDQSNLMWWRLRTYANIGAATCPVDVRGCELFEQAEAFYFDRASFWARNMWSGVTQAGSGSYRGRVEGPAAQLALNLKNQITASIDLTSGNWLKEGLVFDLFQLLPGSQSLLHSYGETAQLSLTAYTRQNAFHALNAESGTTEAAYWRYWAQNSWDGYTSGNLDEVDAIPGVAAFLGFDWSATATDYTSLPTQRLFGYPTDSDESWTGTALDANGILAMASRTGWSSTDTSVFAAPLGVYLDHSYFTHGGHYQIYKGNWLYGDTRSTYSIATCIEGTVSCFSAGNEGTSAVEVGAPSSQTATEYSYLKEGAPDFFHWTAPANSGRAAVLRWAGDARSGRSDSAYAYLAFNLSDSFNIIYTGTPNYQINHLLHIKGGGRDYLLRYVDTSLVSSKRMRAYLHFPNNGQTGEGNTAAGSSGVIRTTTDAGTAMDTKVLVPAAAITDVHAVRTSSSVLTLNGNSSETYPTRLLSGATTCAYSAPGTVTATVGTSTGNVYVWIDTSDCSIVAGHNSSGVTGSGVTIQGSTTGFPGSGVYPVAVWNLSASGWASYAYVTSALPHSESVAARRYVVDLGTSTSSEYLVVHELHSDDAETAASASATTTDDWQTVQISHATLPAVAAFARGDTAKTSWGFTSTHDGTAQYVVAGMAAGTYNYAKGGVSQGTVTVESGDESATWTGTAGVWTLTEGDPPASTGTGLKFKNVRIRLKISDD